MDKEEDANQDIEEEENEDEDLYLSSTKNPRGLALIINVENFDGGSSRVGSSVDVEKLEKLWTGYRYDVKTCRDPTLEVSLLKGYILV